MGVPNRCLTTLMASCSPSSRKPLMIVEISASFAPVSAARCVPSTIQRTVQMSMPVSARNRNANSAARRKTSDLMTLIGRKQPISDASHGLNGIDRETVIELRPQTAEVAFNDAGMRIKMNLPHVLEQHLARDETIGVSHHVFQQAKLLGRELYYPALSRDRTLYQIHCYGPRGQLGGRLCGTPSHDSNARQQFGKGEGLHQIVIAAGLEPLHAIVDSAHGGQVNHRCRFLAAQRPDQFQAVQARKHSIDDDGTEVALERFSEARRPVAHVQSSVS